MREPLDDLERLALTAPAADTLLIASEEHPLVPRLRARGGPEPQTARALLRQPPLRRYTLALLVECLEGLAEQEGERLIAGLRDLYAETLYCFASADRWPGARMQALGLRPLTSYPRTPGNLALYHFDLYDYKRTPDWLNARHWANPERWDKARW